MLWTAGIQIKMIRITRTRLVVEPQRVAVAQTALQEDLVPQERAALLEQVQELLVLERGKWMALE